MTKNNTKTVSISIEDQLAALQAIETNINLFLDLPVFKNLSQLPTILDVSVFIVSKDNTSVFNGTESVFRNNKDLILDLTIPAAIAIAKPVKTDFEDVTEFYKALESYMDLRDNDQHPINVFNSIVSSLTLKITSFDLVDLYSDFRRAVDFVVSCDASQFISNDPLTPAQLPQEIKAKILAMVRASFIANPLIMGKGKVEIEIPAHAIDYFNNKGEKLGSAIPNLDSLPNVLALTHFKKQHPYSQFAFYGKGLYLQIMQSVYRDLNCWETCNSLASMLDVDFGSSQNTNTILESIAKHLM